MEGLAHAGLVAKGLTYCIVATLALEVALGRGGDVEDRPARCKRRRARSAELARGARDRPRGLCDLALHPGRAGTHLETGEREGALKRIGSATRGAVRLARVHLRRARLRRGRAVRAGKDEGDHREDPRLARRQVDRRRDRSRRDRCRDLERVPRVIAAVPGRSEGGSDQRWRATLVHRDGGVRPRRSRRRLRACRSVHRPCRVEFDPQEAIGLDRALAKLANAEYGPLLLGVAAAGLFSYGLFCLVQARYRRV